MVLENFIIAFGYVGVFFLIFVMNIIPFFARASSNQDSLVSEEFNLNACVKLSYSVTES